jgi:uncharacterized protein YbjT (DUF2867 family)
MILITGATGTVGSEVVRLLTATGEPFRAMTRSRDLPGVDTVHADFDDPASLKRVVAGVRTLFLLTAPQSPTSSHDIAMLDAAKAAGVTRVVKLSAIGTGERDDAGRTIGAWHQIAEQAVRDSGLDWTILRPSSFATNVLRWVKGGEPISTMTGSRKQGIVDPRDVAAVAVETLLSPVHTGRTYTLTGPDLLSTADQAEVLTELLGYAVKVVEVPLDVAREQMLESGMDSSVVDMIITGSAWVQEGHNAVVTDDVARVLGRPPNSFAVWARDTIATGLAPEYP